MIYKDWLNEWLNNYVKPTCKIRTFERYKLIVDKHIINELGYYELDDITISILQNFISNLLIKGNVKTGLGLSGNSVNSIISVIQLTLRTANILPYSINYVADKIIRPKLIEKKLNVLILLNKKLEAYCLNNKKKKLCGIVICLYTGLRIGELLALKFSDIDFSKSLMNINKRCFDSKNGRILENPKTQSLNRIIPLPKQILTIIKEIKRNSNCEYLINDPNNPVMIRSYQRTFELLFKKLQIQHKGFHSLRHTFAIRALECGMDVKTLSEILGHKNINITL